MRQRNPVLYLAAAGLGSAAAQDFEGQPDCAIPCLEEAIPEIGCSLPDTACQCAPDRQEALFPLVADCLSSNCTGSELAQAASAASSACASYESAAATPLPELTSAIDAWVSESLSLTGGNGGGGAPTTVTEDGTTYVTTPTAEATGNGGFNGNGFEFEDDEDDDDNGGAGLRVPLAGAAMALVLGAAAML